MDPARQRSRKGCMSCRQKRKKCDEIKPVCGRCKNDDDCIWPASQPLSKAASRSSRSIRIQPRPSMDLKPTNVSVPMETTHFSALGDHMLIPDVPDDHSHELIAECLNMFPEVASINSFHDFAPYPFIDFATAAPNTLDSLLELGTPLPGSTPNTFGIQEHLLVSTYRPILPTLDLPALVCTQDGADLTLDEDEEDVFKTTEWLPGALRLINSYIFLELPNQDRVQWSSAINSYYTFFVRYSYDPINLPSHIHFFAARYCQLESVRLAVLGSSLLFYSFLNPGLPQAPLRKHANELINAAATALRFEKSQPNTTSDAQLAGISELLGFYYYTGDLGGYTRCIEQALPIVQKLLGTRPISIHKLYGSETLDIRLFAWCDVFSAMATSRPTRLVYDCNVDALLQRNQAGPDNPFLDNGLEWISGLPDAFLLLTIQILNLKHASMSPIERITRAATIEEALRGWKVWPSGIANSVMRVQRMSAQEIWRHSTILYIYQAVHKATPSREVVQQSVKQIIKLASTLRPGHNPDCVLYIPYFLAGTFAISAKDKGFLRGRLMSCGVNAYMKTLADALDEVWRGSPVDKYIDWTSRTPPLVMF
ncbi:unnamed protein product [Rhizoctonia solani]|uniref:Zn(2)-C6 fungal-type domain-containing protein n=1 Tax=Rhizoctonia solani TaxID=456999 RepID=A0A8H3D7L5_9AGAM|nr:unnamed protein product [Rhizoctonia solani]CAE6514274.1 unnamed protein product [Rhizoctonia solani]